MVHGPSRAVLGPGGTLPTIPRPGRNCLTLVVNTIYYSHDDNELGQNTSEKEVLLMDENSSDVMNIDDLAEYLKLPKPTVYKLAQSGELPGKKAGRQWRFHKDAIDRWLSEKPALRGTKHNDD